MDYQFQKISEEYRTPVIDIFNHFIENGFAAYPEECVPYEFFDMLNTMTHGYPTIVIIPTGQPQKVVGFAFMRPYHPLKTFRRTAMVSYFLMPEATRQGLGQRIVEFFVLEAKKIGVDTLLADISSLNGPSLRFHEKMGFTRCGCFARVGRKFNKDFDVVWMQKIL